jgi:hypothetical protein
LGATVEVETIQFLQAVGDGRVATVDAGADALKEKLESEVSPNKIIIRAVTIRCIRVSNQPFIIFLVISTKGIMMAMKTHPIKNNSKGMVKVPTIKPLYCVIK